MTTEERRQRFELVAREVWHPLERYLRRRLPPHEVDDVLSDVMLVLWRRWDDVPADGVLPWCYAVAARCLANARRGTDRHLRLLRRLRDEPPAAAPGEDPALAEALARLSATDQEVLRLWAWEGLEAKEIAIVLDLAPNTAAARLSRAKKSLRQQLARHDPRAAGQERVREGTVRGEAWEQP